jgi:DNA polymerase-3 subunit beta
MTSEESKSVLMTLESGRVILTSHAAMIGEARVEIGATYVGNTIEVAYVPEYLLEGLKVMNVESVKICVSGKDTPSRIDGDENFVYVVMPVTIRRG